MYPCHICRPSHVLGPPSFSNSVQISAFFCFFLVGLFSVAIRRRGESGQHTKRPTFGPTKRCTALLLRKVASAGQLLLLKRHAAGTGTGRGALPTTAIPGPRTWARAIQNISWFGCCCILSCFFCKVWRPGLISLVLCCFQGA